ncbi:Uncharacterised protein [uncultured archaeon]|nr:Uncharacterised protein [uncultured archaeon]
MSLIRCGAIRKPAEHPPAAGARVRGDWGGCGWWGGMDIEGEAGGKETTIMHKRFLLPTRRDVLLKNIHLLWAVAKS